MAIVRCIPEVHERERYCLATIATETTCGLSRAGGTASGSRLRRAICRPKDLSAYSLTYADITERREGVEMLALARFFGVSSDPQFQRNQERFGQLSEETLAYRGQAETIEQEVAARRARRSGQERNSDPRLQPQLF